MAAKEDSQIVGQSTTPTDPQIELQEVNPSPGPFPFSDVEAQNSPSLLRPRLSFSPLAVQPPPHRRLHPALRRLQSDGVGRMFLSYQLPSTVFASQTGLISGNLAHYKSTNAIALGLLIVGAGSLMAGEVLRSERPVIAAAYELFGLSLGLAATVYPMAVQLGGPVLCYVPVICGVAVAVMYAYRLATASNGSNYENSYHDDSVYENSNHEA